MKTAMAAKTSPKSEFALLLIALIATLLICEMLAIFSGVEF